MPQPLTHYLVLRRAIPEKYWSSWWIPEYKNYFALGTAAPDIFYFPTVPKIVKNIRDDIAWNEIANPLHSNGSYDLFCTLLDVAKLSKIETQNLQINFCICHWLLCPCYNRLHISPIRLSQYR